MSIMDLSGGRPELDLPAGICMVAGTTTLNDTLDRPLSSPAPVYRLRCINPSSE